MDEATYQKLQAEIRMQALENMVCCIGQIVLTALDAIAPGTMDVFAKTIREKSANLSVPELQDPVLSDLVASEFETALGVLVSRVTQSL